MERRFMGKEGFDESARSLGDLIDGLPFLRRTRAISALGNRLMAARTRLLMFRLERISPSRCSRFRSVLKRVNVKRKDKDGAARDASGSPSSDRRSSSATSGSTGSDGPLRDRSNSWYVSNDDWTEDDTGTAAADKASRSSSKGGIRENVRLIKNMNRLSDGGGGEGDDAGVVVSSTSEGGFKPTSWGPLRRERRERRCGLLSNIAEEEDEDDARDVAVRVLSMAMDMIAEAANVRMPAASVGRCAPFDSLQIRVGIHVGSVMCGLLGRRLPKFTDFHDLVRNAESGWTEQEVISLKNMGRMETYLLDPTRRQRSLPQAPIAGQ
ncbi:hypothetical protein ACHAWF_009588 [Thalassiosira exigua]